MIFYIRKSCPSSCLRVLMNYILYDYPCLAEDFSCRYYQIQTYISNLFREHRENIKKDPRQCRKAIDQFGPWDAAEKKMEFYESKGLEGSQVSPTESTKGLYLLMLLNHYFFFTQLGKRKLSWRESFKNKMARFEPLSDNNMNICEEVMKDNNYCLLGCLWNETKSGIPASMFLQCKKAIKHLFPNGKDPFGSEMEKIFSNGVSLFDAIFSKQMKNQEILKLRKKFVKLRQRQNYEGKLSFFLAFSSLFPLFYLAFSSLLFSFSSLSPRFFFALSSLFPLTVGFQ